jgi:hypothetical protein
MNSTEVVNSRDGWPKLAHFPLPAKALVTMVILTMAIAMLGALGQIIVHDIIPTFFAAGETVDHSVSGTESISVPKAGDGTAERGDLFASAPLEETQDQPFYQKEQFVWTLKWTHIHLFGMSMIFIFLGAITLFLNLSLKARTWLIVLPFIGVLIDISGVWLKGYISPAFFWLHIPGGVLFTTIVIFVSLRALWEMWSGGSTA